MRIYGVIGVNATLYPVLKESHKIYLNLIFFYFGSFILDNLWPMNYIWECLINIYCKRLYMWYEFNMQLFKILSFLLFKFAIVFNHLCIDMILVSLLLYQCIVVELCVSLLVLKLCDLFLDSICLLFMVLSCIVLKWRKVFFLFVNMVHYFLIGMKLFFL